MNFVMKWDPAILKRPRHVWISQKTEVILFGDGKNIRAFVSVCPHMGAQLQWQKRSSELRCPWHDFRYHLATRRTNHPDFKCVQEFGVKKSGEQLTLYSLPPAEREEGTLAEPKGDAGSPL